MAIGKFTLKMAVIANGQKTIHAHTNKSTPRLIPRTTMAQIYTDCAQVVIGLGIFFLKSF